MMIYIILCDINAEDLVPVNPLATYKYDKWPPNRHCRAKGLK
jgi:hypothetical protein